MKAGVLEFVFDCVYETAFCTLGAPIFCERYEKKRCQKIKGTPSDGIPFIDFFF